MSVADRRQLIKRDHASLSLARQCALLELHRSTYYCEPQGESAETYDLMRTIDRVYTDHPEYGSRRLQAVLRREGRHESRGRIARLMRVMGIEGKQPGPRTTRRAPGHAVYPNLLRNRAVEHVGEVWASDITYVPMRTGTLYLVVIMDWSSRCILAWELSNSLDSDFCVRALQAALVRHGQPAIFHSDQGCQYTSQAFTDVLKDRQIKISMSGRGRAYDNIFVERFWRSLKHEQLYKHEYDTVAALRQGVAAYIAHYNTNRPHQALGYEVPWEVHVSGLANAPHTAQSNPPDTGTPDTGPSKETSLPSTGSSKMTMSHSHPQPRPSKRSANPHSSPPKTPRSPVQ